MTDANAMTLVAGLIGAGGAVSAQVIAAIFTGKREAGRLEWEKQRQAREDAKQANALVFESKRTLFGRALVLRPEAHEIMANMVTRSGSLLVEGQGQQKTKEIRERFEAWKQKWDACCHEISLLDAAIAIHMQIISAIVSLQVGKALDDISVRATFEDVEDLDNQLERMRASMEKSLTGK